MTEVKRIEAGQYQVSDGRFIIKSGSNWYVVNSQGEIELGPLPTLAAGKKYVTEGRTSIGNHTIASQNGRKQSRKEFNAYLASETKRGNYLPVVIWGALLVVFVALLELARSGW